MRIAQVTPVYYPHIGGVETNVKEISERLTKRGFKVDVLTTDPSGKLPREEIIDGVEVRRFRSWAPNEAYFFSPALKKWLARKSGDYHIVHAHGYSAFPALYAAETKRANRLVFTSHYHGGAHTSIRNLLHIPYKYLGANIFEKADRVIFVSNYEKALATRRFHLDERKIVVIPNGVDTKEFDALEKKRDNNNKVILYVGRLEKYKGVHYVVSALPKLDRRIRLEIVGKGPYKAALLKLTATLGLGDRVRFYQDLSREELLRKYSEADLFVLLSDREAYGITVAEALASETVCLVAAKSALTEWIDDKNCFGIDYPIDLDKLIALINEVIGKKATAPHLLDWDDVTKKVIDVYQEIM
jgi:glycosyltransferase involved in cell wall biosynthesis